MPSYRNVFATHSFRSEDKTMIQNRIAIRCHSKYVANLDIVRCHPFVVYFSFVFPFLFIFFSVWIQLIFLLCVNFSFNYVCSDEFSFFVFFFFISRFASWPFLQRQCCRIVESAIITESERVNKIRATSIAPSQLIANPVKKSSTSTVLYANGKSHSHSKHRVPCNGHHNCHLNEMSIHQKQSIQSHHPLEIRHRKNMEFLIPRAPNAAATCQSQAALSSIVAAPSFTLNDIKSHLSDNFKIIQSTAATSQKMTKKQLKLAQAQLDKLTQINIHLQGRWK